MARLLHLSDIHFGAENPAAVGAAADFVRSQGFDLMVVTGDITQWGAHYEFEGARRWFSSLPGPMLFTPGNHDTPYGNLLTRLAAPFARYEAQFGPPARSGFDSGELSVRAVNTARGVQIRLNWSKGEISRKQARETMAGLAEAPAGAVRIVICHHPLLEVTGGPMTARVRGGPRAARMLAEGGADLVLSGHIHTPFAVALPYGDGHTYAAGAGTLSVRERGAAPGFNVIETDAQTVRVIAMCWTGSHFEPARTWSLPRRAAQIGGGGPASMSRLPA